MLKGIPKILSPELLKVMCEMGHGDRIVIADGNFPSESVGKDAKVIRMDGHGACEVLEAVLELFPLDTYVEKPVNLMEVMPGDKVETFHLTENLTMDVYAGEPALYPRQKAVYDAAFRGERNRHDLMRWTKSMNISSLRQRLYYHGKEIVLGGDLYGAVWDNDTLAPCDILKLPHHASLTSSTRKSVSRLAPKTIVVCVAAGRPDERPHPYIISLLREYTEDIRFTDAVEIPGLVEPVFHESVHMEIE